MVSTGLSNQTLIPRSTSELRKWKGDPFLVLTSVRDEHVPRLTAEDVVGRLDRFAHLDVLNGRDSRSGGSIPAGRGLNRDPGTHTGGQPTRSSTTSQ